MTKGGGGGQRGGREAVPCQEGRGASCCSETERRGRRGRSRSVCAEVEGRLRVERLTPPPHSAIAYVSVPLRLGLYILMDCFCLDITTRGSARREDDGAGEMAAWAEAKTGRENEGDAEGEALM